ncbi:MAG: DUF5666 domain-containing protein [Pseudomonadota bacterium]
MSLVVCLLVAVACAPTVTDRQVAQGGDDGVGGGIGGTGIVGVITDFGSVVVNGQHIEIGPDTLIREDGANATADDLRIGQVVEIQAIGAIDEPLSRVIDVRHEVSGPITATSLDEGRITVLDQAVVLAEGAIADLDLDEGRMVEVSGFRLVDRTIVATRIDSLPSGTLAHLYGPYRVSDDQVQVDGVGIDGIAVSSDLIGREVFVQGFWRNGRILPTQFEVRPDAPFNGLRTRLSIAGFFDSFTGRLADVPVESTSETFGNVKLSDGRAASFGILEGEWSPARSTLMVRSQFAVENVMETPEREEDDRSVDQDQDSSGTDASGDRNGADAGSGSGEDDDNDSDAVGGSGDANGSDAVGGSGDADGVAATDDLDSDTENEKSNGLGSVVGGLVGGLLGGLDSASGGRVGGILGRLGSSGNDDEDSSRESGASDSSDDDSEGNSDAAASAGDDTSDTSDGDGGGNSGAAESGGGDRSDPGEDGGGGNSDTAANAGNDTSDSDSDDSGGRSRAADNVREGISRTVDRVRDGIGGLLR